MNDCIMGNPFRDIISNMHMMALKKRLSGNTLKQLLSSLHSRMTSQWECIQDNFMFQTSAHNQHAIQYITATMSVSTYRVQGWNEELP